MFTRISCRNTLIHRRPRTFEVAYPTSKRRAAELDCGLRISLRIGFQSAIRSPQSEILPPGPYEREIERFESNLSIQIIDQGSSELLHSFDRGNDCRDRKRTCQCLKLLSDIDLGHTSGRHVGKVGVLKQDRNQIEPKLKVFLLLRQRGGHWAYLKESAALEKQSNKTERLAAHLLETTGIEADRRTQASVAEKRCYSRLPRIDPFSLHQVVLDLVVRNAPKLQHPAARANGCQERVRVGRDQDQECPAGRFLQCL